jgi:hypothetical protein
MTRPSTNGPRSLMRNDDLVPVLDVDGADESAERIEYGARR